MKLKFLTAGAMALAMLSMPALAEDFVGGAIKTAVVNNVDVLTDANGMTLYTFDKDTAGASTCYDDCATKWPPAMAAADAKADGDFTIVDRTDGTKMWAYKGKPLYLWASDTKPGDTTGDGVGGVWHTAVK